MRTSAVFTTPGPTNVRFRTRAQDMTLVGDWSAPMPYTLVSDPFQVTPAEP